MERIDLTQIHLWLVYFKEVQCPAVLEQYWDLLSEEEKEQERRFQFEEDRLRYRVTRSLARNVLSRCTGLAPERLQFKTNMYGKPEIANIDSATRISFNLSHTNNLIVLGVTGGSALGIDTENIYCRDAPLELVDRSFSMREKAAFNDLPQNDRALRFYQLWTLKEAYAKARGLGLSIPFDRFGFHFKQDAKINFSSDASIDSSPGRWNFWQLRPTFEHVLAVCAERTDTNRNELVINKCVPLEYEARIDCAPICESLA